MSPKVYLLQNQLSARRGSSAALVVLLMSCCTATAQETSESDVPKDKTATSDLDRDVHGVIAVDKRTGIKVSRHTTRFLAPVDDNGAINFEEAVNRHFRAKVKPEENAAAVVYEVIGPKPENTRLARRFFKEIGIEVPPDDGVYFLEAFAWQVKKNNGEPPNEKQKIDILADYNKALEGPWTSDELPFIRRWMADTAPLLDKLHQGTKNRSKYYIPLITSEDGKESGGLIAALLPGVQMMRGLARGLIIRAHLHLGEGRNDDAWQDLMTCHRLGRLSSQGATLIDRLVGIAIEQIAIDAELRYLEIARPGPARLNRMKQHLAELPPIVQMSESMDITERAMFLDSVSMLARGRMGMNELAGLGGQGRGPAAPVKLAMRLVDWNVVMRMGNEFHDRIHVAMEEPDYRKRTAIMETIEADLKSGATKARDPKLLAQVLIPGIGGKVASQYMGNVLVALLLPAMNAARRAQDRQEQVFANLQTAIALAGHQHEHKTYPQQLEELIPKYLEKPPVDLFSGKPVLYRRTDDGYLLYSVGINMQDDEGRWYDSQPQGDDPGIRMPSGKLK